MNDIEIQYAVYSFILSIFPFLLSLSVLQVQKVPQHKHFESPRSESKSPEMLRKTLIWW